MKFKGIAIPQRSAGIVITEPDQVVPDQSLTLKEILARFTRGEALPVGLPVQYGSQTEIDPESDSEFNIDLEKSRSWDLTEKMEFRQRVDEVKAEFEARQKEKDAKTKAAEAEKQKADFDKKVRLAAKKLAAKNPVQTGSI